VALTPLAADTASTISATPITATAAESTSALALCTPRGSTGGSLGTVAGAGPQARARAAPWQPTPTPGTGRATARAQVISGMIRMATMFATLIIGLMAGPEVSLKGSPTVSPVTAAAWASEPLPP